jgi:hypothetical protein
VPPRPSPQPARNYGAALAFEFPEPRQNRPPLKSKRVSRPARAGLSQSRPGPTFGRLSLPLLHSHPLLRSHLLKKAASTRLIRGMRRAGRKKCEASIPRARPRAGSAEITGKAENRGIWRRFCSARPFGARGTTIEIRRAGRRRVRWNKPPPTEIDICARGGKTVGANVERPGRLFEERALSGAFAWKELLD